MTISEVLISSKSEKSRIVCRLQGLARSYLTPRLPVNSHHFGKEHKLCICVSSPSSKLMGKFLWILLVFMVLQLQNFASQDSLDSWTMLDGGSTVAVK